MCEKTKTVFGCGHAAKALTDCGLHCSKPHRWCFEKPTDCSACKAGGNSVSRGADGRGRYGRQLSQTPPKQSSRLVKSEPPLSIYARDRVRERSLSPVISPWADVDRPGDKSWETSTRKQADVAWLVEHSDRQSDWKARKHNLTLSPHKVSPPPLRDSYERIVELTDAEDDEIQPMRSTKSATPSKVKHRVYELSDDSDRYASKASRRSERSGRRHRVDSDDSMPSYVETPRAKIIYTRPKRADADSSYGYDIHDTYDTRERSAYRHGSKSEANPARSVKYDSTISGSPQSAGQFTNYERIHIPRSDVRYQKRYIRELY